MSLDDGRMAGVLSANKPIDNDFCQRVGMHGSSDVWQMFRSNPRLLVEVVGVVVFITDERNDCVVLPQINTQGRFLHLLAALGIEVPG